MFESDNSLGLKKEEIHIGSEIKKKFLESGLSIAAFSDLIACQDRNVHRIFNRAHVNMDLLSRIGKALKFDFFSVYSKNILEEIQVKIEFSMPKNECNRENICKYCKIIRAGLDIPEK